MPHTMVISSAVGRIWNTIEVSRKLIPFVPRSIALVKPPVCLERWKLRSSRSKCSKTLHATRRMAFWATLAKMAFRSSWNSAAPIRVAPSVCDCQQDADVDKGISYMPLSLRQQQSMLYRRRLRNQRSSNPQCSWSRMVLVRLVPVYSYQLCSGHRKDHKYLRPN